MTLSPLCIVNRNSLSTKDFCIFFLNRIINLKSTIFLLVHFSIFGDLDWEGSNEDKQIKHCKILGTNTDTLFRGGLLLRTEILAYFNSAGFSKTISTL